MVPAMAGYSEVARETGHSIKTIRQNARIYETFFGGEQPVADVCHRLLDKSFYAEALRAPDPHAALALIQQRKADTLGTDGGLFGSGNCVPATQNTGSKQ
jgi:hypothetical protein